jgi:hypothetical protein
VICLDPVEDQEEEASAAAVRAAAEADLEAASEEAAHAEEALEADLVVRTTDRPIFTARILAGAGTDRAITAAVAAVSVRF